MFYIRLADNKYPITDSQVREAFPNKSFPKELGEPDGYAVIVFKPAPSFDATRQHVVETTPALINGEYAQQWRVVDLTAEAIEAQRIATVPATVTPRQIRQALTRVGLRTAVEAAVAAGDQDTKDWYEFATEFHRASPVVAELAAALNVSGESLDGLWALAASL